MKRILLHLLFCLVLLALSATLAGAAPLAIIDFQIERGRDIAEDGTVGYHERCAVIASDPDGASHIESVTITDSGGGVHVIDRSGGSGMSWHDECYDEFTAGGLWESWWQANPPPPGPYTVTVNDVAANSDTCTSPWTLVVPETTPQILTPAADNPIIPDTVPTFSWTPAAPETPHTTIHMFEDRTRERVWLSGDPGTTTAVFNFDGSATQAALSPSCTYEWRVEAWACDDQRVTDPRVIIFTSCVAFGRFTVYSLDPVIQSIDLQRGRTINAAGEEYFSEYANISVNDTDGWDDVSVTTLTPAGETHPQPDDCGNTWMYVASRSETPGQWSTSPYTQEQCWGDWEQPDPLAVGVYTITAEDSGGHFDTVETVSAPAPPLVQDITYPLNGSVIAETIPTFTWDSVPGADRFCLCLEEAGNNTPVPWQKEDIAGDAVSILYDEDGGARAPELAAGAMYRLHIIAWFPDDDPDARVSLTSYAERIIEFWVAPKPAAVPIQGTMLISDYDPPNVSFLSGDSSNIMPAPANVSPDCDLSPDGTKIVYNNVDDGLHVCNADGGDDTALGVWGCKQRWSPDGRRIAFSAPTEDDPTPEGCNGPGEVFVINADGTELTRVTNRPGPDRIGDWSPDGRFLVWENCSDWQAWVGRPDGTEAHAITGPGFPLSNGDFPSWSPDGTRIIVQPREAYSEDEYLTGIWSIAPDGSDASLVVQWTVPNAVEGWPFSDFWWLDPNRFAWSPDGSQIAFYSARQVLPELGAERDMEVYVIDSDGSDLVRITHDFRAANSLSWVGPNTHAGGPVSVTVGNVTVTYAEVVAEGSTTIIVTDDLPAPPPGDLTFVDDFTYHLSTTATISGTVTVAVDYTETAYPPVLGERLSLLLWDGVQWVDITTAIDTAGYTITGEFLPGAGSDWYVALALDRPGVPEVKVMFDACTEGRPSGPGLFVADGDFSNPVRVTLPAPGTALEPECVCSCGTIASDWSPDGTRVVQHISAGSLDRLEVMDLAALIRAPGQESVPLTGEYGDPVAGDWPNWSPSGDRIVYVSITDLSGLFAYNGIAVVNADGSNQHMIYAFPGPDLPPSVRWAQWSPDGARILFQMGSAGHGGSHLYLLEDLDDPGGATLRQLTADDAWAEDAPHWSPDGTRLVVTRFAWGSSYSAGSDIWVIDVDSGAERRITDSPAVRKMAHGWCPYDGHIYFTQGWPNVVKRMLPDGTAEEIVSSDVLPMTSILERFTWMPTGVWLDGLNALPGESVAAKLGIADAENLAGVQAKVRYTGGSDTLTFDSILKAESILDWAMPSPAIGPDVASFLAYASDPETQAVSGDGHLFDLNVTNSLAAQPGDLQLLTFDDLKLSDDWGDPIERISFGGGVHTIPFAYLEVSSITGPVCADAYDPVPFTITLTALDRDGLPMMDCDTTVEFGTFGWSRRPYTAIPVSPTTVALVEGSWSGEIALLKPYPWHQLFAHWGDFAGYSNWFQAIGKGDPSADNRITIFDVIKVANMAIERGEWADWQWWAGDLNRDDLVNIFDVVICANEAMAAMEAMGIGRAGAAVVTAPPTEPVVITTDVTTTGAQVIVAVKVSDCAGMAGIQVELDYDTKKLAYSGVSAGQLLTGASSWTVMANDLGGQVKTIAYTPSAEVLPGGDGTILTFTFNQTGKGKAKVGLTSVKLADVEGGEIPCQTSAGKGGGKIKQR